MPEPAFFKLFNMPRRRRDTKRWRTAPAALGAHPAPAAVVPSPSVIPVPAAIPVPVIEPVPEVEPEPALLEPAPEPANIPVVIPASGELAVPSCSGFVMPGNIYLSMDTVTVNIPDLFSSDSEDETNPVSSLGWIPGARVITSPGDFVNLGKPLRCDEESEYYQERFNMSPTELDMPSVQPVVTVSIPVPYVELVQIRGRPFYKVPAIYRFTRIPVLLFAPAEIGNPGRMFASCEMFRPMPPAQLPEECEGLLNTVCHKQNVAMRCVSWP